MDKYKITRNREPLTPAEIQQGQDFGKFMKGYSPKPKPFFKTTPFYASVAAVGVTVIVTAVVLTNSSNGKTTQPFIDPPLAQVNIADTAYTVDAAKGGYFIYNTGSVIDVPQNAFVDSAGNAINGNVEIHYREFHDPASIFLAGIPMTYDSAGQRYHFESAGMLEITATQNGKPVKVNPASPLHVAMVSNTNEDKYNVYYLDTTRKNWKYIAHEKASVAGYVPDSLGADSAGKEKTASMLPLVAPVLPVKASRNKPGFTISFEPAEFPELTAYAGVRFEVDESKTPYNKEDKKVEWEDVQIKRNGGGSTYTVTFTKGERTAKYVTYIAVDEKNYAAAKKTYDERYAQYQAARQDREMSDVQKHRNDEKRLLNADARRIFVNDSVMALAMAKRNALDANASKEDLVMREFVVRDFGLWNSDCPSSLPSGAQMLVRLIDSRTHKPMEVAHAYLVEKGRNAIFTYYSNDLAAFQFDPEADNMLWAVTPDGKLAIFGTDDFKKLDPKKTQADLEMEVQPQPLTSADAAKVALGF